MQYSETHYIPAHYEVHPIEKGPKDEQRPGKWRTLFLRLCYKNTNICSEFPKTMELIRKNVPQASLAILSALEPGATLPVHKGFYKGVIRYHLGLKCPTNSKEIKYGVPSCYMVVDHHLHIWEDGKDFMFDDCFPHFVANYTTETRVVLLIDLPRRFKFIPINWVNQFILRVASVNESTKVLYKNIKKFANKK